MLQLILKLYNTLCIKTKRVNLLLDLVSITYPADEIIRALELQRTCGH